MSTTPYELLTRFRPDGTVAGVSTRTLTTVGGRTYEDDPVPLSDATDPAFVAFAGQFSAAVVAERDAAVNAKNALESERDALRAELDAIKNPVDDSGFPVLSAVQLRLGIIAFGLPIDRIESTIDSISDDTQRIQVRTYWEFATQFERNHPLITGMVQLMGMSELEADELWRLAGSIK